MKEPEPGDRFTKNGVSFTVKAVERGQVYGFSSPAGSDDLDDRALGRVSLDEFRREVEGAEYVKAW